MRRKKGTSIGLSLEAKAELDTVKAPGQSYDGVIRELVEFWKDIRRIIGSREEEKGQGKK